MTTENRALEQANAQMNSIAAMVAALDCEYDRLNELRDYDRDEMDDDEKEELEELEKAAGDCENEDDARERVEQDALSVEVRSGWHTPGSSDSEPEHFKILLCTGGPAVRIMGTLNKYGEPERAWLEYQDWWTPWIERSNNPGDEETLLAYARVFYFGG